MRACGRRCGAGAVGARRGVLRVGPGAGVARPSESGANRVARMQDGVVYGLFNRQGGPRGDTEFVVPNWWMGMAMRDTGPHRISLSAMLSLDPATVGKSGYAEIFQVGEALDGKPLIDRQHPDRSCSWRPRGVSVWAPGRHSRWPAAPGEPTRWTGRPSCTGRRRPVSCSLRWNHHTSIRRTSASVSSRRHSNADVGVEGPFSTAVSLMRTAGTSTSVPSTPSPAASGSGRPASGRFRCRPDTSATRGARRGDATRTTTSVAWFRPEDDGLSAVAAGYGVAAAHGELRHGLFGEATVEQQGLSFSGPAGHQQVETQTLLTGEIPDASHSATPPAWVTAFTVGAAQRLLAWRGSTGALGAHLTLYPSS